ncbi:hypothetical protein HK100_002334 [Physocladia obscura]|uniref:Uncharacterized protein n=1 Tax=Physocladia obscura TaxID=109957 RepID=A0AAD5XDX4_9FUNG|nr:hypothetical protein HK100_002334 [Physocladia obscura]
MFEIMKKIGGVPQAETDEDRRNIAKVAAEWNISAREYFGNLGLKTSTVSLIGGVLGVFIPIPAAAAVFLTGTVCGIVASTATAIAKVETAGAIADASKQLKSGQFGASRIEKRARGFLGNITVVWAKMAQVMDGVDEHERAKISQAIMTSLIRAVEQNEDIGRELVRCTWGVGDRMSNVHTQLASAGAAVVATSKNWDSKAYIEQANAVAMSAAPCVIDLADDFLRPMPSRTARLTRRFWLVLPSWPRRCSWLEWLGGRLQMLRNPELSCLKLFPQLLRTWLHAAISICMTIS